MGPVCFASTRPALCKGVVSAATYGEVVLMIPTLVQDGGGS